MAGQQLEQQPDARLDAARQRFPALPRHVRLERRDLEVFLDVDGEVVRPHRRHGFLVKSACERGFSRQTPGLLGVSRPMMSNLLPRVSIAAGKPPLNATESSRTTRFPDPSLTVSWKAPGTVAVSLMIAFSTRASAASAPPPLPVAATAVVNVLSGVVAPIPSSVTIDVCVSAGWPSRLPITPNSLR